MDRHLKLRRQPVRGQRPQQRPRPSPKRHPPPSPNHRQRLLRRKVATEKSPKREARASSKKFNQRIMAKHACEVNCCAQFSKKNMCLSFHVDLFRQGLKQTPQ